MDQAIRVMQVLASLDRGGAEAMIMNLYQNIDRQAVQFDFAVNRSDRPYLHEAQIRALGGRIFYLPRYAALNHFQYRRAWARLLRDHPEWTVIHAHHTTPAFIYLRQAKKLRRVTIAHSHIAGIRLSPREWAKVALRYPLRHLADHLFACSKIAADWMFGSRGASAHILKNAIDADQFIFRPALRQAVREQLDIADRLVVGHIGRFDAQKNHPFIIRIFRAVHDRCPDSVLLLIGDGADRPAVERQAADLGLSGSVRFLGVRSDVPSLLQAMDVFLFPSLFEGLGIVAVEAQAAGLRTIVSEAVPEEAFVTGLIEKASLREPPEQWADRILAWRGGYERTDTSALIRAGGYDIHQTAAWLQDFYLQAGGNREQPG